MKRTRRFIPSIRQTVPALFAALLILSPTIFSGCSSGEKSKEFSASFESESTSTPPHNDLAPSDQEAPPPGTPGGDASAYSDAPPPLSAEAIERDETAGESVTLVMVGDILLHDRVEDAARREDGSYDFSFVFDQTRDLISAADLAIVNQEVILGGEELGISGYPSFNGPYEVADVLAQTGFDVVLHATNHALDRNGAGVRNALSYWNRAHPEITVLGIHDSAASQEALPIVEVDGIRIAMLNYTYGTNGIPLPDDMPYAVDLLEENRVIADLQRAEEEADFTIVFPHWGTEYMLEASDEQRYWMELFRENGADLVLGCHPHVIEPIEWLEDGDSTRRTNNHGGGDMLVYYSLGNFVNWTAESGPGIANRLVGGMAQVEIGRDANGEVSIQNFRIRPLVCHVTSGQAGVTVYPLASYTEELAEENEIRFQDDNFSLEYCRDLCLQVWEGYY